MRTLLLFLTLAIGLGSQASAQTSSKTNVVPDCGPFFITFTGATRATPVNNIASVCSLWTLAYTANGFSALSIELDSAPDNNGTPGSWVPFAGTTITGSNPSTNIQQNQATFTGFYPWVSVNVTSVTGSGTIKAVAYGYKNSAASTGGGGGGGGGGDFKVASVLITAADIFNLNTAPITIVAAPGIGKYIQTLGFTESYEAGSDPFQYFGSIGGSFDLTYASGVIATAIGLDSTGLSTTSLVAIGRQSTSNGLLASDLENQSMLFQLPSGETGAVVASTLANGGTGYLPGQTLTLTCGVSDTVVRVDTVGGSGNVLTYTITSVGAGRCAVGTFAVIPFGGVLTLAVNSGGTGYAINDTFTVDGSGGDAAIGHVVTVNGMGAVLTLTLNDAGFSYTAGTNVSTTATSGVGAGLTVDTTVTGSGFTINVTQIQTYTSGNGNIRVTLSYILASV